MSISTFKLTGARAFEGGPQVWRQFAAGRPSNPVPSMIGTDEMQHLEWLAAEYYAGDGAIVDMGPLAGGSTHALASGLMSNGRVRGTAARIHSYDMWEFAPGWDIFFPGHQLKVGADIQPLFEAYLAKYRAVVSPHRGDLGRQLWRGGPIELLFVDAAKTPDTMRHIFREFFPHLLPGRSIVIHQDWICAECPWIHLVMGVAARHFEPVDSPDGGTVSFLCTSPIPREMLERDPLAGLAPSAADRVFDAHAEALIGWYRLEIELARAHWLALSGNVSRAASVLEEVRAHQAYHPAVDYDIRLVSAAITQRGARR